MLRILALASLALSLSTSLVTAQTSIKGPTPISPVMNPFPEAPFIVEAPEDEPFVAAEWTSPKHDLILPGFFVWERGGWTWPEDIKIWRLDDERLAWNPLWTQPETHNSTLRYTENLNDFDMPVQYVHFEDWLPVEDIYKCEALLSIQLAIKVHRLTLLPDEITSLDTLKADVCSQ